MVLKCGKFEEIRDEVIKYNKRIIIYGAGVIGAITAASIIVEYELENYLDAFIDNDMCKHGEKVIVGRRQIDIKRADFLNEIDEHATVIVLAISRCNEVIKSLDKNDHIYHCSCYILPMMCIDNYDLNEEKQVLRYSSDNLIPKKIHYMWLGKNAIPDRLKKCIETWEKYCPGYEIICWNESNYDLTKNDYMIEAYDDGAYGFVPDYARLDILYNHGGIYMDTDVELLRPLDELLCLPAFCGVEKWQTLNFGGCSGAQAGNKAIKLFLESRANEHYRMKDGRRNRKTCGYIDTKTAFLLGYRINGRLQKLDDITILPYDYFHPYDYMSGRTKLSEHTFGIHHFNGGWMDSAMVEANLQIMREYDQIENRCRIVK